MGDSQLDLFGEAETAARGAPAGMAEPAPADFVQRIRDELHATLDRVGAAEFLPWANLTAATLAELRFKSIADWLPKAEADRLRSAFEAELRRIYANEDARFDASEGRAATG